MLPELLRFSSSAHLLSLIPEDLQAAHRGRGEATGGQNTHNIQNIQNTQDLSQLTRAKELGDELGESEEDYEEDYEASEAEDGTGNVSDDMLARLGL